MKKNFRLISRILTLVILVLIAIILGMVAAIAKYIGLL